MAGRLASRLPLRNVAVVSRTGATLPGVPASGLHNLARYESPLVAHSASDDDARNTPGQAEDRPIGLSCFIWYPKELWILGLCTPPAFTTHCTLSGGCHHAAAHPSHLVCACITPASLNSLAPSIMLLHLHACRPVCTSPHMLTCCKGCNNPHRHYVTAYGDIGQRRLARKEPYHCAALSKP